ncbi:MAG TPA: DUF4346 domain-containing protein [Candidatus Methylomirabilis sp.]|jgi:hypothetical protein|nr:DUF4346 domain-containing protein [Candidatus Methylomirabilis sp.]
MARWHPPGGGLAAAAAVQDGAAQGWVAICTLAERELPARLAPAARLSRAVGPAVGLVGPLLSIPRGLERLVANLAARPAIQSLLVCGRDPRGVPAREALRRFWGAGLTPTGRIRGLPRLAPLRNLNPWSIALVRCRVRLMDLGSTRRVDRILREVGRIPRRRARGDRHVPRGATVQAPTLTPRDHGLDPAGYFVILAPTPDGRICCEHYRRDGTLTRRFLGRDAAGLCQAILQRRLPGTLAHAAYLGRELQKAEDALRAGVPYSQDDPVRLPRGRARTHPVQRRALPAREGGRKRGE